MAAIAIWLRLAKALYASSRPKVCLQWNLPMQYGWRRFFIHPPMIFAYSRVKSWMHFTFDSLKHRPLLEQPQPCPDIAACIQSRVHQEYIGCNTGWHYKAAVRYLKASAAFGNPIFVLQQSATINGKAAARWQKPWWTKHVSGAFYTKNGHYH